MASPKHPGRMIRTDISRSHKIAKLTPKALSLLCLIIPHLNSHGKLNGDPLYIKAECAPLIPWVTPSIIKKCLQEINEHTNVKWFESEGCWYIHALSWWQHQEIREDRRGKDLLPSYPVQVLEQSGSSPGVVPHEVEVEVEVEVEGKVEIEDEVERRSGSSGGVVEPPPSATVLPDLSDLTRMKQDVYKEAFTYLKNGEWTFQKAHDHIKAAQFTYEELSRLMPLLQKVGGEMGGGTQQKHTGDDGGRREPL